MKDNSIKSIVQYEGLTTASAYALLEKFGENVLPKERRKSSLTVFISQLKSPLVYVLLAAGLITILLKDYSDALIIFIAVFVNSILGYFQESKAGKALEALKKLINPTAQVFRDGEIKTINAANIVPGDIVILTMGDKIPADGMVVECQKFFVSEAILTGESIAVVKNLGEKVFMGTIVSSGKAYIQITLTGRSTEMGKIATSISNIDESTPLHKQLAKFSNKLSLLVLLLILIVLGVGVYFRQPLSEVFVTSVALAVSSIPEGLLIALTAVLAIGMQRVLARKGLVRNLVSAETLGGVTTICTDKTGTLTYGKMQVVNVLGDVEEIAGHVTLSNDLDTSVVIAAWEWGNKKLRNKQDDSLARLDSLPFSSENKFSANLYSNASSKENIIFVTGAPDILLSYTALDSDFKNIEYQKVQTLAKDGKRLLAFARKKVSFEKKTIEVSDVQKDLEWVGMLAFNDPVREDVSAALKKTHQAGIKLIVITGDFAETARSVLKQLGIFMKSKNIITGDELGSMSIEALSSRLKENDDVKLFARVKPDQKLKIIETLKQNGEVVAMTGDGVNDAPALSKADIGIVVGDASDVAKESADLVLLDSSFSTIVSAIEEGRTIFDNIRKIILFLLSDSFEEIVLVFSAMLCGFSVPLTASQILWVNLVSDGFPSLALTIDPKIKNSMDIPPRSPKEALVTPWMIKTIGLASLVGGISALILFWHVNTTTNNLDLARSVAFATVGMNSLIYVFSIRTLREPFWKESFFANKWLVLSVLFGLVLQLLPFINPVLREFFRLEMIGLYWWAVLAASLVMFLVIELSKLNFRQYLK